MSGQQMQLLGIGLIALGVLIPLVSHFILNWYRSKLLNEG